MVRTAILGLLTPDKVQALAKTLVDQAVAGDHRAREHLLAFFGVDLRTLAVSVAADSQSRIEVVYIDQAALAGVQAAMGEMIEGEYSDVDDAGGDQAGQGGERQ